MKHFVDFKSSIINADDDNANMGIGTICDIQDKKIKFETSEGLFAGKMILSSPGRNYVNFDDNGLFVYVEDVTEVHDSNAFDLSQF